MKPALPHLFSDQRNRYQTGRIRNSAGFSMVGVLVASTVGAVAVLGLSQLSTVVARKALRAQQMFNFILLSEEIKQHFMQGKHPGCSPPEDCWNACTNSLIDYDSTLKQDFAIKSSPPTPPSGTGAGITLYSGGDTPRDIKIQKIEFTPGPQCSPPLPSTEACVSIHFSLSEDKRETLTAPLSLDFHVSLDKVDGGKIKECTIVNASISGHGSPDIPHGCRKVELEQSLIGCGGTIDNTDLKGTAFGYRAGYQSIGDGNTFFGHEAGRNNTTGSQNTAVGYRAGEETTGDSGIPYHKGSYNTFLGNEAGWDNKTGLHHIAIGGRLDKAAIVGKSEKYKLNIGNLIEGTLNKTATPSPPPPNPEVIFKGPVHIKPPITTATSLSLEVFGAIKIKKKEIPTTPPTPVPDFTIKEDSGSDPTMHLMAHGMKIHRKSLPSNSVKLTVEGTDKDPELKINADVYSGGSMPHGFKTGGKIKPGVEIRGKWKLRSRDGSSTTTLHTSGGDPGFLNIDRDITVESSGPDTKDRESLFEKSLGGVKTLEVLAEYPHPDPTKYPNDKAEFQNLTVRNPVNFDNNPNNITATDAKINDLQVANKATITTGTIVDPLIIPAGRLSPHGHSHGNDYHADPLDPHPGEYLLLSSGHTATTTGCPTALPSCAPPCGSSRTLKRNIKPFKSYEKSLENILNTPLFTYQYKEGEGSHPDKVRMGIISEELPKDLQILTEVDSENHKPENPQTAKNKKKNRGKISTPDWLSIYGTLWAGVKALAQRLQNVTEESGKKLAELSQNLKKHFTETVTQFKEETASHLTDAKKQGAKLKEQFQKQKKQANQNNQEFSDLKKQFQQTELILENSEKELKTLEKELKSAREQLKKILSRKKKKSVSRLENKKRGI